MGLFDSKKDKLLLKAAEEGDHLLVQELLKIGANMNVKSMLGWRPLDLACIGGHLEVVKVLVAAKRADVNVKHRWLRTTVLDLACGYGHLEVAKLLVEKGADVRANGPARLYGACENGHLEVVKWLLQQDAKVHDTDECIWIPLHRACETGHLEIVKVLLQSGADIHAKDAHLWTPLHWACYTGSLDIVKVLLENGANIHAVDDEGETPSNVIPWYDERRPKIREILSRPLSPISNSSHDGKPIFPDAILSDEDEENFLLHCSVKYGDLEVIKGMIHESPNATDKNAVDSSGRTAIDLAALTGQLDVLKLLEENGCKHNRPKPKMIAICKKRQVLATKYLEQVHQSL